MGGARKRALLRVFGSVKRIETATLEDLLQVPLMNERIAQDILQALHDRGTESSYVDGGSSAN